MVSAWLTPTLSRTPSVRLLDRYWGPSENFVLISDESGNLETHRDDELIESDYDGLIKLVELGQSLW